MGDILLVCFVVAAIFCVFAAIAAEGGAIGSDPGAWVLMAVIFGLFAGFLSLGMYA